MAIKNGNRADADEKTAFAKNKNDISAKSIKRYLESGDIRVEFSECVTSTNDIVKLRAENGEKEGLLFVAASQTAGKGRMGRKFISQKDTGIYFSILLRPELKAADTLLITTCAAVAAAKAIEELSGKKTLIKWVNDIYIGDKKVCGILTSASFDGKNGIISYAVLGIGVNVYFDDASVPFEIADIAGGMFDTPDYPSDAASRVAARITDLFMNEYAVIEEKNFVPFYRSRSYLDGREITVIKPSGTYAARAIEIDDSCALVVEYENGETERLTSGDVSTKIKKSY